MQHTMQHTMQCIASFCTMQRTTQHARCIRRAPAVTRHARTAQVADTGTITTAGGASFAVRDVKKF